MITSETKLPIIDRVSSVTINTKMFANSINKQVTTYISEAENAETGLLNLYGWFNTYFILIMFSLTSSISDK